jgi:serine/threonine protein kinase
MQIPHSGITVNGPAGRDTLKLAEHLGAGSFGVVFKATAMDGEAVFAVKFPHVAVFTGEDKLAAFFNEVRASQEIAHPNVVRVAHIETQPAQLPPYIVMEFVRGGTLRTRLTHSVAAGQQIDVGLIQKWTTGLVAGIEAVNTKMLHRDLRPENILMDGDIPKVSDFGLSKIVGALTRTLSFKGGQHVLYMAPEGWRLEANTIQLDMYALGIVLFEICTLAYPYRLPSDARDFGAIQHMHFFSSARTLASVRTDLPPGVGHVIARLLAKRADDRFPNWPTVRDALDATWRHGSVGASGSGLVPGLLTETARIHGEVEQGRLQEEHRKTQAAERRQLDIFQAEKLLGHITEAIEEFNVQSSLGSIRYSWSSVDAADRRVLIGELLDTGVLYADQGSRRKVAVEESHGRLEVSLPHGWPIEIRLFWLDPALRLKPGTARLVCFVWDTGAQYFGDRKRQLESDSVPRGCTYLLVRTDASDLYGRWGVLTYRMEDVQLFEDSLGIRSEEETRVITLNWCNKRHFDFQDIDEVLKDIEEPTPKSTRYQLEFESELASCFLKVLWTSMKAQRFK